VIHKDIRKTGYPMWAATLQRQVGEHDDGHWLSVRSGARHLRKSRCQEQSPWMAWAIARSHPLLG